MTETINLIEQKLGENKEVLRRLSVEQENFITALADGHAKKKQLSNENFNLERQLKDLYELQCRKSNIKSTSDEALEINISQKMVRQPGSHTKGEYIDRGEDALMSQKQHQ